LPSRGIPATAPTCRRKPSPQLEAAFTRDEYSWYQEGSPSREARLDYVAERLRLLYVGITRARQELIVTWNTGRGTEGRLVPAIPFTVLSNYLVQYLQEED
jgi:superfamily I DNA/RNA helicase